MNTALTHAMDATLTHVFRSILPPAGAVNIVQDGPTIYEEETQVRRKNQAKET